MLFRRHRDPLRRCPECRSRLVCPMSWEQADDQCWSIDLRCGDCEQSWTEVVPNDRASRYDLELDRDVDAIQRSLDRLERNHMISEIETFVAALDRDLIEPADFAR